MKRSQEERSESRDEIPVTNGSSVVPESKFLSLSLSLH